MNRNSHTHPSDCPDRAPAASDRKRHDAAQKDREAILQRRAHAEWFDWYPPHVREEPGPRVKRDTPLRSIG